MKILVIGGGGREHSLVWKISESPLVKKIYAAPGNAGIAALAETIAIRPDDLPSLCQFAKKEKIDLTVVGPELPLTLGIVDLFQKEGLSVFGPSQEAARLEGSKAWTKEFLRAEGIPTAHFEVFDDFARAVDFLGTQATPVVIKADGLAAGKGVIIAQSRSEAVNALELILKKKVFGEAGRRVVIEEFLAGEEASFLAFLDGDSILPLDSARDYKRVGEGDEGPNTGGMGSTSPAPAVTGEVARQVVDRILGPTQKGLLKRGICYKGILYAGLMINASGPKLLEYNVRFGDPETEALMVRLEGDLVEVMMETITGRLKERRLSWKTGPSVSVVMTSHGYPDDPKLGDEIEGLDRAASIPETVIFHAGTKREGDRFMTAGGRVLAVTSCGKDLRQARERAYDACEKIYWRGVHYRRDIGMKFKGEI